MSIMGIIDKPVGKIDNYKTYLICMAAGILGILQEADVFTMSSGKWLILSALGLGAIRHTLKKLQGDSK